MNQALSSKLNCEPRCSGLLTAKPNKLVCEFCTVQVLVGLNNLLALQNTGVSAFHVSEDQMCLFVHQNCLSSTVSVTRKLLSPVLLLLQEVSNPLFLKLECGYAVLVCILGYTLRIKQNKNKKKQPILHAM